MSIPNVTKVQISVNGDNTIKYREKMDLSTMYERNLDYMDENAQSQEEQIEEGNEKVVIEEEDPDG